MKRARKIWGIAGALLLGLLVLVKYSPDDGLREQLGIETRQREETSDKVQAGTSAAVMIEQETELSPVEKEPVKAAPALATGYAYGTLDKETKQAYDEVYETLMNYEEKATLTTLNHEVLDAAYKAVCADYGGIFWASGYVYTQYTKGDELIELEFSPQYTMTREQREEIQVQIDAKVDEILAGISPESGDYEKAKYIFDYLASNVDYVIGAPDNQNIISVFLNGQTVCQGYACATQYLFARLGIECSIVTGEAEGQAHAWNLVKLDGDYYYMDTTWGNSTYTSDQIGVSRFVNYNYFCVTTAELMLTHQPNNYFVLPVCTAMTDNYYIREGKYFSEWNPDAVGNLCREAYETGNVAVSIRFATEEVYHRYRTYFIDEQHIADYCSGISTLYYVEDVQQNVLTFNF